MSESFADPQAVAALLEEHPGVQRAAVIRRDGEGETPSLLAFVVPNPEVIDSPEDRRREDAYRLKQWRTVYDWFEKGKPGTGAEAGLDTSIWNSSYTRTAIPSAEMREWCELTVQDVLACSPSVVLEIGCGTGALLLRLAPRCEQYVGVDFSAPSLKAIARELAASGSGQNVTLMERAADQLEDLPPGSYDTVVINSVTQCFPSTAYLMAVLRRAVDLVRPEGAVFIGDVRSLPLLPAFATSVELYQAPGDLTLAELRQRVRKRLQQERELVISPTFFLALQRQDPRITDVAIAPKRAASDNEMTRFRYDVTLRVAASRTSSISPAWVDWTADGLSLDKVERRLQQEVPPMLGLRGVRNARVEGDVAASLLLEELPGGATVADLREALTRPQTRGVTTHQFQALGLRLGYQVDLSWAAGDAAGGFDVLLRRTENPIARRSIRWPAATLPEASFELYVSDPSLIARRRRLVQELKQYLKDRVPEPHRPVDVVLTEDLP